MSKNCSLGPRWAQNVKVARNPADFSFRAHSKLQAWSTIKILVFAANNGGSRCHIDNIGNPSINLDGALTSSLCGGLSHLLSSPISGEKSRRLLKHQKSSSMQAKTVMGGCYVSLSSVAAPALPNSLTSLTPTNNTCNNKSTDTRFRRHSFDKRGYKTITSVRIYKNHISKIEPTLTLSLIMFANPPKMSHLNFHAKRKTLKIT